MLSLILSGRPSALQDFWSERRLCVQWSLNGCEAVLVHTITGHTCILRTAVFLHFEWHAHLFNESLHQTIVVHWSKFQLTHNTKVSSQLIAANCPVCRWPFSLACTRQCWQQCKVVCFFQSVGQFKLLQARNHTLPLPVSFDPCLYINNWPSLLVLLPACGLDDWMLFDGPTMCCRDNPQLVVSVGNEVMLMVTCNCSWVVSLSILVN